MRKQAGVFQKLAARLGVWTLAFGLVLTTSLSSNAEYRIIHSESVQYTDIAPGVRHELHQFFTEEGWIVVNVVRSKQDASDSVVPLYTKGDLTSPRTLSEFVKNEKNVVAAINGDYYDYKSEAVLGRLMDRGALVQTSNRDKKHAHVEIGRDGKIAIGYEDGSSVRLLYGGNQRDVAFVNKRYTDWDNILLFDRAFGAKSPGFGDLRGEGDKTPVVEYRVEKGNVVQMIRNDEEDENGAKETESVDQLDIPEGGLAEGNFIIRAQGKYAEDLVSTLKVGDTVELLLPKMPYTSISGGAQLVKDGKVVDAFTHNVYGEHPRTAIGVEKDGKTVLFVTVNGRSSSYRGIRQSELAELMVKLGAYQALILDGGGSTEMIIDNPYRDKKEIVSFLSDGSERRIYNGLSIQVQSTSNSKIQKMRFATSRMNGIQGVPMKLELEAIDQSFRNYPLTNQNVVYESLGLEGKFENGTFIPSTSGTGVISATVDGVKAYTDVRVSERIQQLIAVENQGFYQFYLESADGYRVRIGSEDVTAYIDGGIAEYRQEEGRIVPLKDNVAGYVTFSYDISARDTVTTNSPLRFGKINNRLEDFESHSVYASNAKKINIQIVDNPTNAGKAGAVRYKKSLVSGSKDMKYFPAELTVEKGRDRVLFDMYSEKKADIYVELMVLDEKGVGRFLKVTDSIDRTGWQTYTMEDLHEGDRIYLIAVSSQDEGIIYFDNFRYDDEQGSDYIPRDINYVKDYKDYRIQSDGDVFVISYQSEMKEEQLKRLTEHFHYLEIENDGGYIRAHDGFAQWRLLLDTLENARRPVLVKFSGTYYFPDKKAMDLLFRYVESCPQPVYMVFQAYEDLTDIFMYRKAHVIELKKKTEELQISEDLQMQISDLQLQEKKND